MKNPVPVVMNQSKHNNKSSRILGRGPAALPPSPVILQGSLLPERLGRAFVGILVSWRNRRCV